jgi:hypothetical protein
MNESVNQKQTVEFGGLRCSLPDGTVTLEQGAFIQGAMELPDILHFQGLLLEHVAPALTTVQQEMLAYTRAKHNIRL